MRAAFASQDGALSTSPTERIRVSSDAATLLPFVRDLMEKNYEAVGFIPAPRLADYAERGQVLLQYENGEPCGYLAFGNGWPVLKVYQCCICYDARRVAHATQLVLRLIDIARERNCIAISLWCADDLEANGFWRALGFHFGGKREGGVKRGRMHNKWVLFVTGTAQLMLFDPAQGGVTEGRDLEASSGSAPSPSGEAA